MFVLSLTALLSTGAQTQTHTDRSYCATGQEISSSFQPLYLRTVENVTMETSNVNIGGVIGKDPVYIHEDQSK